MKSFDTLAVAGDTVGGSSRSPCGCWTERWWQPRPDAITTVEFPGGRRSRRSCHPARGGEHRSTEEKQRLLPEYLSANAAALLTAARGERGHGAGDDGAVEAAVAAAGTDAVDRVAL